MCMCHFLVVVISHDHCAASNVMNGSAVEKKLEQFGTVCVFGDTISIFTI